MIHLTDNDIVAKLAQCDMLDDAIVAFDAERKDVCVLPTLMYRFGAGGKREKAVKKYGEQVVDRVTTFLADVQKVENYSEADQAILDDIVGIDPGEAILLSATAVLSDYRLLTGDKRCLKTIATAPECRPIAERIQGRVVCFEQVLCRVISRFGFSYVVGKVAAVLDCDTALRAAFGSGLQSAEATSVACLQNYIAELRTLPIDLLIVDT